MVAQRVVTDGRCNKVTRDHQRTLMDQLIERMLPIGTGFAPDHGSGMPFHRLTVTVHAFPVAFHISLLEISGKTMHILVIGKDGLRLGAKEIGVPETDQRHGNGYILFERRFSEMKIGLPPTLTVRSLSSVVIMRRLHRESGWQAIVR